MRVEESTSHGRSDLVLHAGQVFILEFKMAVGGDMAKDEAMGQIHDRGYANKYRTGRQRIHLLSMACRRDDRNVVEGSIESA